MACVAFRLFLRRVSPSGCFHGVCRLPVSRFWRVSLSLVSWCLSTLHFVFVACVAYKLFSWRVSPSGYFYGVCRLQVVFSAQRLSSLGCFYGVCRLPVSHFWRVSLYFALHLVFIAHVAYNLFSWHVPPSSCFHGVCRLKVSGISD